MRPPRSFGSAPLWGLLLVLILRLLLPLWHVASVEHGLVGGRLLDLQAASGAGHSDAAHGLTLEIRRAGSSLVSAAHGGAGDSAELSALDGHGVHRCWLDRMEAPRERPVEAIRPVRTPVLAEQPAERARAAELIWAATRFRLAPCLSPPDRRV